MWKYSNFLDNRSGNLVLELVIYICCKTYITFWNLQCGFFWKHRYRNLV